MTTTFQKDCDEETDSLLSSQCQVPDGSAPSVFYAKNNNNKNLCSSETKIAAVVTVLSLLAIVAMTFTPFVIQPGMVGMVVTLGKVRSCEPGWHWRNTVLSKMDILSTKTQLLKEHNKIPTKEGLSVQLDTAILYHLDVKLIKELYRNVGIDYVQTVLEPEAASAIRGLTSESEAKALYSGGRNVIQDSLKIELSLKMAPLGIIIEDVLLTDLLLPDQLSKSIELKVQAEQEAARMEFVLKKEEQEAQRKGIEAGGIAEFQRIVSEGISPELLQWKGVEATEHLADSQNAKIVMMGNGNKGLPVLMSAGDE